MAVTVTLDAQPDGLTNVGALHARFGSLNLGSYATNGVAVGKGDFNLSVGLVDLDVSPAGGYVFEWDKTNGKVKAYRENGAGAYTQNQPLVEVANAVDLTSVSARFRAFGR